MTIQTSLYDLSLYEVYAAVKTRCYSITGKLSGSRGTTLREGALNSTFRTRALIYPSKRTNRYTRRADSIPLSIHARDKAQDASKEPACNQDVTLDISALMRAVTRRADFRHRNGTRRSSVWKTPRVKRRTEIAREWTETQRIEMQWLESIWIFIRMNI